MKAPEFGDWTLIVYLAGWMSILGFSGLLGENKIKTKWIRRTLQTIGMTIAISWAVCSLGLFLMILSLLGQK